MKASKFTDERGTVAAVGPQWGRVSPGEQKAFILKQGEQGTPVAEICRKASISQANWLP